MKIQILSSRADGRFAVAGAVSGNGRTNTLLAAVAGGLHAVAFGGPPLWWLELLALALLVWRAGRAPGPWAAARLGWAFGLGWFGVGVNWVFISMHEYGGMHPALAGAATALFCGFLALFPALATGAWTALLGRGAARGGFVAVVSFGALWGATEWLRGWIFTGFPWIGSGLAHVEGPLAGWLPVIGQNTVNAVCGFVAAALVALVESPGARFESGHGAVTRPIFGRSSTGGSGFGASLGARFTSRGGAHFGAGGGAGTLGGGATRLAAPLIALALLGGGMALTGHAWTTPVGEALRVRLVQGNVAQDMKFAPEHLAAQLATYARLAGVDQPVVGLAPQLIVMPETAIPVLMPEVEPAWIQALQDHAARTDATVLTGVPLVEVLTPDARAVSYFNSVIALDADSRWTVNPARGGQRYDKHHLVPFSEFIPFGFRWFVDAMVMPLDDFTAGAAVQPPLKVRDQLVGPNVCYEDLFGAEIAARFHRPDQPDATLLLNVSNLAWFDDSAALPQHLLASRARALETGRPMLRATNTGMTAIVGPDGRVQAQLAPLTEGVLDGSVQGMTGLTPYTRIGDAPLLVLGAFTLMLLRLRRRVS